MRLSFPDYLRLKFSDTQRYVVIWSIAGVACGLAAVGFHQAIDGLFRLVQWFANEQSGGRYWQFLILIGLAPAVGGLISGIVLAKLAPGVAGSGIPQTKAAYYREFGVMRLRDAFYRFIVGSISVGFGMSLGREGPTVHICAAIASNIGRWFGLARERVQAMVPIGMGAGISAAFNTPMAAVFFVFEELLGNFSSKSFFGIFLAVVIAAVVQRLLTGGHAAFSIALGEIHTDWWMLVALPLGFASALLGHWFVATILASREWVREQHAIPVWMRPAIGGLGVGLIGVSVMVLGNGNMGIFGIGYRDLDAALNGRLLVLSVVLLLLVGKLVATVLAYASGGSGGLFAPTLFIGGMLGALFGLLARMGFGLEDEIVGAVALLGMGAFFAAVIRSPMTSIVIIWEMTGLYSLILPLMAGNMIAYLLSQRLRPVPLYDALLLQDKINLKKSPNYQGDQDWRNLPVSTIMTFDPVTLQMAASAGEEFVRIKEAGLRHHGYPVLDESGALCAVITHHELEEWAKVDPKRSVADCRKARPPVTLHPETSIREAARTLVMEDVLQAPVVSQRDPSKVLGIVTLNDVARQQNAIDDAIGRR